MPEVLPPAPPRSLSPSTPADYKLLGSAAVGAALSSVPLSGSARGWSQSAALLLCLLASGGARGESRGNRRPLGAQGVRRECPRGSPGALFRSPGSPSGSRSALLPVFRTLELSQVDFRPCCGANFTRTYFKVTSKFFFGVGGSGRRPRESADPGGVRRAGR